MRDILNGNYSEVWKYDDTDRGGLDQWRKIKLELRHPCRASHTRLGKTGIANDAQTNKTVPTPLETELHCFGGEEAITSHATRAQKSLVCYIRRKKGYYGAT